MALGTKLLRFAAGILVSPVIVAPFLWADGTTDMVMLVVRQAAILACLIVVGRLWFSPRQSVDGTDAAGPSHYPVPRLLADDPLNDLRSGRSLSERIGTAVDASLPASRTVGIAYFAFEPNAASQSDPALLMGAFADRLRRAVRPTDHVAVVDQFGIAVCLPLIAQRGDLESVGLRLNKVLAGMQPQLNASPIAGFDLGLSIYPLGGYSGEELIESARSAALMRRDARLAVLAYQPDAATQSGTAAVSMPKLAATKPAAAKPTRARRKSAGASVQSTTGAALIMPVERLG